MSQKTDSSEFAPGFVWQICLLGAAVLAFTIYSSKGNLWVASKIIREPATALHPWVIAGLQTMENGLAAFSGMPPKTPPLVAQTRLLAALIIVLVISPTVFLLGWRRRRLNPSPSTGELRLHGSGVLYLLTGVITVYVGLSAPPIVYFAEKARGDLRRAQSVQDNRDQIITDLNFLALDIYQYRLLPRKMNGGAGSYVGYTLPPEVSKARDATYSAAVRDNEVAIHARSTIYPSASVKVTVDATGRLVWWEYAGEFR
ncbi:MAG: hypothetical protein FJ280_28330 [Planctomycetes bacterium]|nr:hypothetical protein [Deltaproteobacteria bacterium]MBM4029272.1 hypothetical protein [Planctomycetota bacterium]